MSNTFELFDLYLSTYPFNFGSRESNGEALRNRNRNYAQKKPVKEKARRILIVENELLVSENVKEIVESAGYEVVETLASGEAVIENFARLDPDLILMDIRLSGSIDGIQTAVAIHYTLKEVPIIFLTAYAEDQFPHLAAVPLPLFKFVTKPCDANELTQSIKELLKGIDTDSG